MRHAVGVVHEAFFFEPPQDRADGPILEWPRAPPLRSSAVTTPLVQTTFITFDSKGLSRNLSRLRFRAKLSTILRAQPEMNADECRFVQMTLNY
jgi:hypothetical protein